MVNKIWNHTWVVAACNLILIMAAYTLSRVVYYYANIDLYPNVDSAHLWEMLLGGMRFDLTAMLYLSALYLVLMLIPLPWQWRSNRTYQTVCKWVLLVPNLIGLITNTADTVYIRFSGRRTDYSVFQEFSHESNIASILWTSLWQYWYLTLFFIVLAAVLIGCCRSVKADNYHPGVWFYYPFETALLLVSIYFTVIGIRGGFGAYTRPITMSNALQYTNTPQEAAIVLNTPFSIIRSTEGKVYKDPHYFEREELESIMAPIRIPNQGGLQKKNVVVFILESFSKEYIGFFNKELDGGTYRGYTPFLDSLCEHSVTYRYSFASGRKSIDAMPSVLSSIPMLIEPYILTPYSTNNVSSIAACLGKEGYTTAFFHGAPNGSMGFQAYARSAGFARYYGMDEYDGPEAFDGTWAIWDEEFLQYYARTMSTMQEPFMTAVFTASSHHPFRVPQRYQGVFPEGEDPIHPCIGYSDNALRQFFSYAKTQPWYENTLFVLTADHTNHLTHPEYLTAKGVYEVPIIFFDPSHPEGDLRSTVMSQTDIMPSVLSYLGYDKPYFSFGEDGIRADKQHPYAICYNNAFQLMSYKLLIQFDGQQVLGIYDYSSDPLLQINHRDDWQQREDVSEMLRYLKAYVQQYITRMIDNRLTVETDGNTSR